MEKLQRGLKIKSNKHGEVRFNIKRYGGIEKAFNVALAHLGKSNGTMSLYNSGCGSGGWNEFVIAVNEGKITYKKRFHYLKNDKKPESAKTVLEAFLAGSGVKKLTDIDRLGSIVITRKQ